MYSSDLPIDCSPVVVTCDCRHVTTVCKSFVLGLLLTTWFRPKFESPSVEVIAARLSNDDVSVRRL